jgi:transposase-like protein
MSQVFCQSKAYRNLSLDYFYELNETQARELFCFARWGGLATVVCPYCGAVGKHYYRKRRGQWRCKECDSVFSVTTGTTLADRKLSYRKILIVIFFFVSAPQSDAANRVHSALKLTMRTVYILFGKLRESLWEQRDTTPLNGTVHIDGGHFCGKPRRARKRTTTTSFTINSKLRNRKASIVPPQKGDRLEPWNVKKLKNRRVVLVMRQVSSERRVGASRSRIVIVKAESAANVLSAIRANVTAGATIMTDSSSAYTKLSSWFNHLAVNHTKEYSTYDGVNQNQAELYFSRLRRAEYGVFHGMRCQYFALYAHEMAWREDVRRKTLQEKFDSLMRALMRSGLSKTWRGYNQGHRLQKEHDSLPII